MIPTYVINLDKDKDRLQEFDDMMKSLEWKYERFPALKYSKEEHADIFKKFSFLKESQKGCTVSHLALWKKLLESNHERMMIFEDDARTHLRGETLKQKIDEIYAYLQEKNIPEPDILYLGKALDRCSEYEHVKDFVYISKHPVCLHAYIITKKAVQTFLEMIPYSRAIDIIPIIASDEEKSVLMVFHPSLFFQDRIHTFSNLTGSSHSMSSFCECVIPMMPTSQEDHVFIVWSILIFILLLILFFCNFWQYRV